MINVAKSKITKCQEGKQHEDAEDLILKVLNQFHGSMIFLHFFHLYGRKFREIVMKFLNISCLFTNLLFVYR